VIAAGPSVQEFITVTLAVGAIAMGLVWLAEALDRNR